MSEDVKREHIEMFKRLSETYNVPVSELLEELIITLEACLEDFSGTSVI